MSAQHSYGRGTKIIQFRKGTISARPRTRYFLIKAPKKLLLLRPFTCPPSVSLSSPPLETAVDLRRDRDLYALRDLGTSMVAPTAGGGRLIMRSPSLLPTAPEALALSMSQLLESLLGCGRSESCNVNGTFCFPSRAAIGDFSLLEPSQIIDVGRILSLLFLFFSSWTAALASRPALASDEAGPSWFVACSRLFRIQLSFPSPAPNTSGTTSPIPALSSGWELAAPPMPNSTAPNNLDKRRRADEGRFISPGATVPLR